MKDKALGLLREMTGNLSANFHADQYESIYELVVNKKRMLVVQKTGWGKSAVYFIATKLLRDQSQGPSIIISPLIALMRNQIMSAEHLGLCIVTINSSLTQNERTINERKIINQEVDAIIISPEQLANDHFLSNILTKTLSDTSLFVIDEAHCISDWGHDFRPDYRRIARIVQFMPTNMPILATTATANNRVVKDIQSQIGRQMTTVRGELVRSSLRLQNFSACSKAERLAWLAATLPHISSSGIVYVKTVRDSNLVTNWLRANGIDARAYYGSVNNEERITLENNLIHNQLKVLVATSALGMGFDKPDIGFVIHFQAPGNVIEYYQQVGRAGRNTDNAHGVLMLGEDDETIQHFFIKNAFPSEENVLQLLEVLENNDRLKVSEIEERVNISTANIKQTLKFLSVEDPTPIYKDGAFYSRTAIDYQLPHDRIERLSTIKAKEWQELKSYHASRGCLMRFLANVLDDFHADDCGKCANCLPQGKIDEFIPSHLIDAAQDFIKHDYVLIKPRKRFAASSDQVRSAFPIYQLPYAKKDWLAENGLALSRWRDGVWGDLVAEGKKEEVFSDKLITPMVTMIKSMSFEQQPKWLAYIPSLRRPELVKNFAHKLAYELGIYCSDAIQVIELRPEQKKMENNFRRSKNLDGMFRIDATHVYSDSVLLLDDAVDSGWTFTVVAALLRRLNTGRVYPIALTSTSVQG